MSNPIPSDEWNSRVEESQTAGSGHSFPPRPEVVEVNQANLVREAVDQVEHEGYRPSDAPLRQTPQLLRPEQQRRPLWRRSPGQRDDMGEPATVFAPDTRNVIVDTSFPWRTCGRVAVPGGWGSGVMV